jgi:hypothetical protein
MDKNYNSFPKNTFDLSKNVVLLKKVTKFKIKSDEVGNIQGEE